MSAPTLTEGSLARAVRDTQLSDHRRYPEGFTFVVEDYVPASEAGDGVAFYWGSANGGMNNVCMNASDVELVLTAEEMRARTIPTRVDVLDALKSAVCGLDEDDFTTDEAETDSAGCLTFYGETHHGLRFACSLRITALYQCDF